MKYRESQLDKKLRTWFQRDHTRQLLKQINLVTGRIRGLESLNISFEFPITAVAGKNGAGKSTILALACCAFHNSKSGFKLTKRKFTYYTFSDFFVQHLEEIPPSGLVISYQIAHNKWRKTDALPSGIGLGVQYRRKNKGGKWNDYDTRVRRNVVFLGIERIVPHSERSQSKSYSKAFKNTTSKGWEEKVKDVVGYILDRSYKDFRYVEHSKYSLPIVKTAKATYSGFNMGAGENALFEIFSTLYSAGDGALIVMDEIELGLHAGAQRKFIEKLKEACLENHSQVICTTHSKEIFECLPMDARYFLETVNGKSKLINSISSDFAFSKMGNTQPKELEILVEDDVAESLLSSALPVELRTRIKITVIGSASALSRQLAAIYLRDKKCPVIAIFDGDQKSLKKDNLKHAKDMAENPGSDFEAWFNEKSTYLPGESWPESWIMTKCQNYIKPLSLLFGSDTDAFSDALEYGVQAGKHQELRELAKNVGLDRLTCLSLISNFIGREESDEFTDIVEAIKISLRDL